MIHTPEPLLYRRRKDEEQKEQDKQKSAMDALRVEHSTNQHNQVLSAVRDKHYMTDALQKVRQSSVTHNEDLMRMNGTWLYNQTIK